MYYRYYKYKNYIHFIWITFKIFILLYKTLFVYFLFTTKKVTVLETLIDGTSYIGSFST